MKKYLLGITLSIMIIFCSLTVFYYRLGIGFGQAVVDSVEEVNRVKEEWKTDEVNLIDSFEHLIIDYIDDSDSLANVSD